MQISTTEAAIIAKLQATFGGKLAAVDSLPEEMDKDALQRLLRRVPGAYVVFHGGADPNPGGSEGKLDAEWSVIGVSGNAAGEKKRRLGDSTQIGAYDIAEAAVPAIHRLTVPGIGTLIFRRIEVRTTPDLDDIGYAAIAAVFGIQINLPGFADPTTLAAFTDAVITTNLPESPANPVNVQDVQLPQ